MACFPFKLYKISRFLFCVFTVGQASLLAYYVFKYDNESRYACPAALFFLPLLVLWCVDGKKLKHHLSWIWFVYMVALVSMIGMIFGRIVIVENKLKGEIITCNTNTNGNDFFDFGPKSLKITLCFTPGEMLLLLTSVAGEADVLYTQLYFTIVMDLFDGVEMLEVLHEDVCDKMAIGWQIAVVVAACVFFLLSFLGVQQVKFPQNKNATSNNNAAVKDDECNWKLRKKTVVVNTIFEIVLNLSFLVIRLALWFLYDLGSTTFLFKNVIGLAIGLVPVLEECGFLTSKE